LATFLNNSKSAEENFNKARKVFEEADAVADLMTIPI
jgi:hypothetical protein